MLEPFAVLRCYDRVALDYGIVIDDAASVR